MLIQRVALTRPDQRLPLALRVGVSSLDDVQKFFGELGESEKGPRGATGRRFYDSRPGGYEQSALFWFDDNRKLAGVEWRYEID